MSYVVNSRGELVNNTAVVTRTFINSDGEIEAREFTIDDFYAPKPDEIKVLERWETVLFCRERPIAPDTKHSFLRDTGMWLAVSAAAVLWCCLYFFSIH